MNRTHDDIPKNGPPFHARIMIDAGRFVRAWSKAHIPLSPTGATRELRDQLRNHLPKLKVESDSPRYLRAEYGIKTAPDGRRVVIQADVENNLFYNIGLKAFAASARFGIRFQKIASFDDKHFPDAGYSYDYTLVPAEPAPWRGGSPLLVLRGQYPRHAHHTDWSTVWLAIKERTATPPEVKPMGNAAFGLAVELRPPENPREINLAGLLKPIFDGVICALHHDESTAVEDATDTVAEALRKRIDKKVGRKVTAANLRKHLRDKRSSLLGATPLVRVYRDGCKCYPWDHLCVAGELLLRPAEGGDWEIKASVFQM